MNFIKQTDFHFLYLIVLNIFYVALYLLFIFKSKRSNVTKLFRSILLMIFIWSTLITLFYMEYNNIYALFLIKSAYFFGSLIPAFLLLFTYIFPLENFNISNIKISLLFLPNAILAFLYFGTQEMIESTTIINGSHELTYGKLHSIWNFYFFLTLIFVFIKSYKLYKLSSGPTKETIKMFNIGGGISFILIGILNYLFYVQSIEFEIYYLIPLLTLPIILLGTYSILTLKNIVLPKLFKKLVAFLLLLICLFFINNAIIFLINFLLGDLLILDLKLLLIPITITTLFIFKPLYNLIYNFINNYLFPESILKLAKENNKLKRALESDRLKPLNNIFQKIIFEIKNPLTTLKGYSTYLKKNSEDHKFVENFSDILSKEIDRLTDLINHLSDCFQPGPISSQNVLIVDLLDETLKILKLNFNNANINLIKSYHSNKNLGLNIDPSQIKQVLLNILDNAIDAMPNGGTIEISTKQEDDVFLINIKDSGSGIQNNLLPKVFDTFFTQKENHVGLGLTISKEIIRNHSGRIYIESKLYGGTTVTIELPISRNEIMLTDDN